MHLLYWVLPSDVFFKTVLFTSPTKSVACQACQDGMLIEPGPNAVEKWKNKNTKGPQAQPTYKLLSDHTCTNRLFKVSHLNDFLFSRKANLLKNPREKK